MWLEGPARTEVHSKYTQDVNHIERQYYYLGMHIHSNLAEVEAVREAAGHYMEVFHNSAAASTAGDALVDQAGDYMLLVVHSSEPAVAHSLVAYSRAQLFLSVPAGLVLSATLFHGLLTSPYLAPFLAAFPVLLARGTHREDCIDPRMAGCNLVAPVDLLVPAHCPPSSQICCHCVGEDVSCPAFAMLGRQMLQVGY